MRALGGSRTRVVPFRKRPPVRRASRASRTKSRPGIGPGHAILQTA